jgi:amino-acid N-acetyltransferase
MIRGVRIRAARALDLTAILEVLDVCSLKYKVVEASTSLYHLAMLGKQPIGCVCGEVHGETVVIRAVAVLPEYRDQRIATHLVGAVLMRARANGCKSAALFTTRHPSFFARYGFSLSSPEQMPEEIRIAKEFHRRFSARTYCMCRRLD